jgi:hypothetical protein
MTLKQLIEHCMQQSALADAEMQLLQRNAWRSLNNGFPLAEGLDYLECLGLIELKLSFWLKPLRPNLCVRFYRWIFKLPPKDESNFRLTRSQKEVKGDSIHLSLTISRGRDGSTQVTTEPNLQNLEKIHVAGINV